MNATPKTPMLDRPPTSPADRRRAGHWAWAVIAAAAFGLAAVLAVRYVARYGVPDLSSAGHPLVPIWLALLLGATSLLAGAWGVPAAGLGAWRRLSVSYSVACVLALLGIWTVIEQAEPERLGFGTAVLDGADVDAQLVAIQRDGEPESTLRIPTGVFVQTVEIQGAADVAVTGYAWQKYADGLPADFIRGVVLPEAIDDTNQVTEAYRQRGPGYELVAWYVNATLRQSFDYRRYPFDRQDVRLRLWSADRRPGVILMPDFDAYPVWAPAALLGVERNFVGNGWRRDYSVFSYAPNRYDTSFGLAGSVSTAPQPELYFNIGLQRRSLNMLIHRVILLGAASLIILGMVLATERAPDGSDQHDLSFARTLGLGAALLFVLAIDYGQFRSELQPDGLTYLGYAYLLVFFGLALAILNAMLYSSSRINIRLIEYEQNAIPNIVVAPLLLTIFLAITLALFFGA